MDKKIQILLGSEKNINSTIVDTYEKIKLSNNTLNLIEYNINDSVNATDQFDAEREENNIYRIYGRIEYLSLLNGLKSDYSQFQDFLVPQNILTSKNIKNSFNFYLVKPGTGYTNITGETQPVVVNTGGTINYAINEDFTNWVTASPTDYPLGWNASVSTNCYIQQTVTDQAEFVMGTELINLSSVYKDISPITGDFVIETDVSVSSGFNPATDLLSVLLSSNGVLVQSIPLLTSGVGYKKIDINIPETSGITRVTIFANSNGKSIFIDYFQLYSIGTVTTTDTINTVDLTNYDKYERYFEVIATPDDFDVFPVGYSNNVYGEQGYSFIIKKDIDVSAYFDEFGFPATELFIYAEYIMGKNGFDEPIDEMMLNTRFLPDATTSIESFVPATLNIGDYVKTTDNRKIGDYIGYSLDDYNQIQFSGQTYYIKTTCKNISGETITLSWKYNPFISLRLRYFGNDIYVVNSGTTTYEDVMSIPEYAAKLDDNGNYIWRDILPQGYTDPILEVGVDYPFFNGKRYLFSVLQLPIMPDLNDLITIDAFNEIWYSRFAYSTHKNPLGDLNNIGKPCQ